MWLVDWLAGGCKEDYRLLDIWFIRHGYFLRNELIPIDCTEPSVILDIIRPYL